MNDPRLSPCVDCAHPRDQHLGCRTHDVCCEAPDCGCLGYEPPATRAAIERVAAFVGVDADELEAAVRQVEADATR